MKLKTKVITPENSQLDVEFEIIKETGGTLVAIVKHHEKRLGYANFSIVTNILGDEHLFVILRESESKSHKGVGSALGEGLFRYSMMMGFDGRLKNSASWSSHIFHYKWGMRPTRCIQYSWGGVSEDLDALFDKFWGTDDPQEKAEITKKIKQHKAYRRQEELLLEERALTEISLDEVAESVKIDLAIRHEQKIIKRIALEKQTGKRQESDDLGSITMYLPNDKIEEKKKLYEITPELIIEDLREEITRKNLVSANNNLLGEKLHKEINSLKEQLRSKEKENDSLKAKSESEKTSLDEKDKTIRSLEYDVTSLTKKITQLDQKLMQANQKVDILNNQNKSLAEQYKLLLHASQYIMSIATPLRDILSMGVNNKSATQSLDQNFLDLIKLFSQREKEFMDDLNTLANHLKETPKPSSIPLFSKTPAISDQIILQIESYKQAFYSNCERLIKKNKPKEEIESVLAKLHESFDHYLQETIKSLKETDPTRVIITEYLKEHIISNQTQPSYRADM
jgi:hypothetical protein